MNKIRKHSRLLLVAVCCLAIGAGASAIATAGATSQPTAKPRHRLFFRQMRAHRALMLAGRAVHGDLVVATRKGFVNVTFDRGSVASVNGQQLTITEGTRKMTYKSVTVTVPNGARIRDNGQQATMSSLKQGQRVVVVQAPAHTFVIAHTVRSGQ
jgi:hypothetical protein